MNSIIRPQSPFSLVTVEFCAMAHVNTVMSGWFHGGPEFGGHFDTNSKYERHVSVAFTGTISWLPTLMLPCLVGTRGARYNGARGNALTVLH